MRLAAVAVAAAAMVGTSATAASAHDHELDRDEIISLVCGNTEQTNAAEVGIEQDDAEAEAEGFENDADAENDADIDIDELEQENEATTQSNCQVGEDNWAINNDSDFTLIGNEFFSPGPGLLEPVADVLPVTL